MKRVAIIGTAGRDKGRVYDLNLWCNMWDDALSRFKDGEKYRLVSGGAAWADQLAVELFLAKPDQFELELYLPAPLSLTRGIYLGEKGSAGAASNYYHDKFLQQTGIDGRRQILQAIKQKCDVDWEESIAGMRAFFVRNKKVAEASDACLAYTWGEGKEPADGGTKNTWNQIKGRRVHVPLTSLIKE